MVLRAFDVKLSIFNPPPAPGPLVRRTKLNPIEVIREPSANSGIPLRGARAHEEE